MGYFDDEDLINDGGMPEEAGESSGFEDLSSLSASFEDGTVAASGEPQPSNAASEEVDTTVTAQPVKFASFEDLDSASGLANQNLGILLDVKLQLTVELGKTLLPIKKVLELTKGSVVTLDKVAGEPVELYANGKLIAGICATPSIVFSKTEVIKNKDVTCYPNEELISNLIGCNYVDSSVVVCDNLITSQSPATATDFALAILEYFDCDYELVKQEFKGK